MKRKICVLLMVTLAALAVAWARTTFIPQVAVMKWNQRKPPEPLPSRAKVEMEVQRQMLPEMREPPPEAPGEFNQYLEKVKAIRQAADDHFKRWIPSPFLNDVLGDVPKETKYFVFQLVAAFSPRPRMNERLAEKIVLNGISQIKLRHPEVRDKDLIRLWSVPLKELYLAIE